MNSQAGELKQTAHTWLDTLSDDEITVVVPILQSLGGLLSAPFVRIPIHVASGTANLYEVRESYSLLERQLEQAVDIQDLQILKENISACLNILRENKSRLSGAGGERPGTTGEEVSISGSEAAQSSPSMADALTGLPTRLLFERVVTNTIAEGKEALIALFKVERLPYINKRFGRATGDEIVLFVAQYLAEKLPNSSLFVRWSGPAFASMLTGKAASKEAALELRAISRKQLSKSIDVDGRPVMLPITCSCIVETISVTSSPEKMFAKMDEFLSAHMGA